MTADREALVAEEVEMLARWLHDDVGGCCVEQMHECVFGGREVRKEAATLLTTGVLANLLAAREQQARAEAWDEGEDAGYGGAVTGMGSGENPYREVTP